jgi:hypothetical protein
MSKDIRKDTFVETSEQYGNGICLDDYNNQISLCNANPGEDQIYLDWVFPQGKDRKPIEKSLPWKVSLGSSAKAVNLLRFFADKLEELYGNDPKKETPVKTLEKKEDVPF